ncbi:MAG: integrase core domain-containing protein [Acidobacteriia bacterium]|nr:integrase core domain-containing protein [Terriglobia bacterium]
MFPACSPSSFPQVASILSWFQTRASLQVEILALRHQVTVLKRSQRGRLRLNSADRLLWVWLCRFWANWRWALLIVKPETVIAWHRKGFRIYWTWKSHQAAPGRPTVPREVRDLIRKMSLVNPLWGAPRIHGELLKLGIELSQATVAKYMQRHPRPPSQTWRTFLDSHLKQLVSTDFFVVPALSFRILFVFVVLAHHRRRVIHFNVTAHPTSEWTAQQIAEAFPWDTAPRYLLHDRDSIYGDSFRQKVRGMAIREVLTAPRSPWQSPYVERLIGSIRWECLDHLIVFNESSLRRTLKSYFDYYHGARTHLSLEKDAPETRPVQPPELGSVVELPEVGGLHRYERRAA